MKLFYKKTVTINQFHKFIGWLTPQIFFILPLKKSLDALESSNEKPDPLILKSIKKKGYILGSYLTSGHARFSNTVDLQGYGTNT